MGLLYNIGIRLYGVGIGIAALSGHKKAKLWREGRRNILSRIAEVKAKEEGNRASTTVWIHAASLGEFEQGRPIIEQLKQLWPEVRIVVTFFSPSGYEVRKSYPNADHILYLPLDTPHNARRFLDSVRPDLAIFIKYEFWLNYLSELHRRHIPTLLVSAIFRPSQIHFRPWGHIWRDALHTYSSIFVQDEASQSLLNSIGCRNSILSGDTRFDRVAAIAQTARPIPEIEHFRGDAQLFIAGSTWDKDENILIELINRHPKTRFIIAPHEIDETRIANLERSIKAGVVRYTRYSLKSHNDTNSNSTPQVMVLDTIGLLSSAYGYARWAYIGGGFGVGIHNTLEAATFGLPIAFGPNYKKFREARDLIARGAAMSITNIEQLEAWFSLIANDDEAWQKASSSARRYTEEQCGATATILNAITDILPHN